MKKFSLFMLVCIVYINLIYGADVLFENDSLIKSSELESTIVFLEDTQRVSALSSRLRMILDARRSVGMDTVSEAKTAYPNIIQLASNLKKKSVNIFEVFQKDVQSLAYQITVLKTDIVNGKINEHLYSFLFTLLFSVLTGIILGVFIKKSGLMIKRMNKDKVGFFNKSLALLSVILIKNSFALALIGIGLIIIFIPTGFDIRVVGYQIITGLFVYTVAIAIIFSFFNPESTNYRILPVGNDLCERIVKNSVSLIRFSLVFYIIYCVSSKLVPISANFFAGFYMLAMIFWIPGLMNKYRRSISEWFVLTVEKRMVLPRTVSVIVNNLLKRMDKLALIYLLVTTILWFSGLKTIYNQILGASIKTIGIAFGVLFSMAVWVSMLAYLKEYTEKLPFTYSDFKAFYNKNVVIVRRAGLVCILAASVLLILKSWGVSAKWALISESNIVKTVLHVIFILLISFLLVQVIRLVIDKFKKKAVLRMSGSGLNSSIEIEKRVATLGNTIQRIAIGIITLFSIIMVMDELGFDIKAMLAGVGIVGLAVGFGAQNLVRDVISGLFLIMENSIRVGDVAIINGTGGSVEQVNLRTSVLRGIDGTLHVFPNGSISTLSNMTHDFSYYVFNIGVSYNQNLDKVISVLKDIGNEIINDPQFADSIMEPLEISGVDSFNESSIIIRARIKTLPIKQWFVGREMNFRIKKRFDEEGISMPFPHRTVYLEDSGKPLSLKIENELPKREEIKGLIREVMEEIQD